MRCLSCQVDYTPECETCQICGRRLETDPDRYFKAGMDALEARNTEKAIRFLETCSTLNPNHLNARFNLGIAYMLDGQFDLAARELYTVAEKDSQYPGLLTALGQLAFNLYNYHLAQAEVQKERTISLLESAIARDPEDVDALFTLGSAYVAFEQPAQALDYLKRAAAIDGKAPVIYFAMAKAFSIAGNRRQAVLMARKYLRLSSPDDIFREEAEDLLVELEGAQVTANT